MLTLPTFKKTNPSKEDLREESVRVKRQADKLLEQTNLINIFKKYGELIVQGSYNYNLMIYPDLDFMIIAKNVDRDFLAIISSELIKSDYIRKVKFVEEIKFRSSERKPYGYWVGIEIPFEGDIWGIDLWVQEKEWVEKNPYDPYPEKLKDLEQEAIDAILNIKYHLIRRGDYGNKYFSSDVYNAVLDHGVTDIITFDKSK